MTIAPVQTQTAQSATIDHSTPPTLSKFYPPETAYFYSFPSGEDSHFFNGVPAWKEELVAARPLVCAGNSVRVVTFSSSIQDDVWTMLTEQLGVSLVSRDRILPLPRAITSRVTGAHRNSKMKSALCTLVAPRQLVMAQPYIDSELLDRYQISPELIIQLNNKSHRSLYIPQQYLPETYETFPNGEIFAASQKTFPIPCVVKVSSSSSGDGVRICRKPADVEKAKKDFHALHGTIFVEKYIDASYNFGIQFGVPHDRKEPIEIIGYNEQLTTARGDYLGGMVHPGKTIAVLNTIYTLLTETLLPNVRRMGWYGVGGIDVLVDAQGHPYFIDPNFRMTAAFTYVYLARTGMIKKPMVSFTGMFQGTEQDFMQKIVPRAREYDPRQIMRMITLTRRGNLYMFNAGMFFDQKETIEQNARELLGLGIRSLVLKKVCPAV